jgi:hypothetical protein
MGRYKLGGRDGRKFEDFFDEYGQKYTIYYDGNECKFFVIVEPRSEESPAQTVIEDPTPLGAHRLALAWLKENSKRTWKLVIHVDPTEWLDVSDELAGLRLRFKSISKDGTVVYKTCILPNKSVGQNVYAPPRSIIELEYTDERWAVLMELHKFTTTFRERLQMLIGQDATALTKKLDNVAKKPINLLGLIPEQKPKRRRGRNAQT